MRRVDRRRVERIRRAALTIGISFAIGALTALALTWRLARPTPELAHAVAAVPEPAAVPTVGPADDGPVIAPRDRDLAMPVDGVDRDDLRDNFAEAREGHPHEALDILARRGTPVRAVRDGRIEKLFTSKAGGLTIYQFDPSDTYAYYYAHLDRYAADLTEGQEVDKGDLIGYVGSTGNASPDAPHLHFAVFRLTPERQWWKGEALNPYPLLK